jgi:kinesin family protein 6/9
MTTMIATLSNEDSNIDVSARLAPRSPLWFVRKKALSLTPRFNRFPAASYSSQESISTCRFAQRVALVKNDARINEETGSAAAASAASRTF